MRLVVDANVIFSALISGGKTFEIFLLNRELKRFKLAAPEFLMVEVENHIEEILEKTKLSSGELGRILDFLEGEVEFVPFEDFRDFFAEAGNSSPDPDDVQYFALALKIDCGIWSNDKALTKQNDVKVFSTKRILDMLD